MLYTTPTYALGAEVCFTSCSSKGESGDFMASESPLRTIGGGATQAI